MKKNFALITGAGEGLGRSFAMECAIRGYDLLLVSLPGSRLEKLSGHIENHYGVKVWWLEMDLCQEGQINELVNFLTRHNLPVTLLINNAGVGHTQRFDELPDSNLEGLINLNVRVSAQLTHHLFPVIQTQGGGHILNVGSMACFYPLPYKSAYAASKAFLLTLSLALRAELASVGIGVSVVCPNGINSNIKQYQIYKSQGWLGKWCFMQPDRVAGYAVDNCMKNIAVIVPGRINRFLLFLVALMPAFLKRHIAKNLMKPAGKPHPVSNRLPMAA